MADIIVSLTKRGREMEAQALLYGYGYRIDYFSVGSGGHDPGNPTLALPLDLDVTTLPGEFFGPEPIDKAELVSSTCPRWTCILQPGEAVGQISNIGLTATVVFIPAASFLANPVEAVFPGTSEQSFGPFDVNVGTETITIALHGFVNGDQVIFSSNTTLPTGLNDTTEYYVVGASAGAFQVSLTNGGLPVDITTQGAGTHKVRLAIDDTFTKTGHGLVDGNNVIVISTGAMPGGMVSGQTYFVVRSTANTFKLAETFGGAPIDITTTGNGVLTFTNVGSIPSGAPEIGSTFLYGISNFPARFKLSSVRETYVITLQT